MTYRRPIDEETKAAAVKAFRDGKGTMNAIAKQFEINSTTLHCWIDPQYKRARMDRINEARNNPKLVTGCPHCGYRHPLDGMCV